MDDKQRLQLQDMIKTNNVEDQTELIRILKHSEILRSNINNMIMIKAKYRGDDEKIAEECMKESHFLFTYYTDIFNKVKKDEIDIGLLYQFLNILNFFYIHPKKFFFKPGFFYLMGGGIKNTGN